MISSFACSEVNSRVGVTDGDQVQDITRVVILVQCSMVEGTETLDLRDNGQIRGVLVLHVPCLVMSLLNVGLLTRG